MATREEMLAEAARRGILPPEKQAAYEEAVRRGLMKAPAEKSEPAVELRDNFLSDRTLQTTREALRHVGRLGAAAAEGGASVVTVPADLLNAVVNMGLRAAGVDYQFPSTSEAVSNLVRDETIEPQNATERVQEDAVRGVVGGLSMAGAARSAAMRAAASGSTGRGAMALKELGTGPGVQAAAAATGAIASGVAREEGGGPLAQTVAGMIGGVGGGAAGSVGRGAGALARTAVAPAAQREVIAGNVLRNSVTGNVDEVVGNLRNARELVPGSAPTAGQVARDPGLAFFENRLRSLDTAPGFAQRASTQNTARQQFLDDIADGGLPEGVQRRIANRERLTTPLRDRAFTQAAGKRVDTGKVLSEIDGLLASPDNAGESVQRALQSIRRQIAGDETGPMTDARALYAVRKEINRVLEGRYIDSDESVLRYAGLQLGQVKTAIDNAITEVAPSWRRYLNVYTRMSKPIERATKMGEIRDRTSVAAPDVVTGESVLSQAKFRQVVTRNRSELQKVMTEGQFENLQKVAADLDRGAAAARIEPVGSATAANLVAAGNMTIAHVIGRVAGMRGKELHPSLSAVAKPLSWMLSYNDQQIRQLLGEAMLDPKMAARLIEKGTPEAVESAAEALELFAKTSSVGGAIGEAVATE